MAKLYAKKVKNGELKLEEVPLYWRDKVEQLLNESN